MANNNRLKNLRYYSGDAQNVIDETIHALKSSKKSIAILNLNSNALGIDSKFDKIISKKKIIIIKNHVLFQSDCCPSNCDWSRRWIKCS